MNDGDQTAHNIDRTEKALREYTKQQIREYRNYLVIVVAIFSFGIASTANGSSRQSTIALLGFFFVLLLVIFLGFSYQPHFFIVKEAKRKSDKHGVVTKEEYDEILSAGAFYKECMTFKEKDWIAVVILGFSLCYLIYLI